MLGGRREVRTVKNCIGRMGKAKLIDAERREKRKDSKERNGWGVKTDGFWAEGETRGL